MSDPQLRIVFDFAGVLFHWQPQRMLQRVLPQHVADETAALRLADAIFQGYGGDWAEFDRGRSRCPSWCPHCRAHGPAGAGRARGGRRGARRTEADAGHRGLASSPACAGRRLHFLSNMPAPYAEHLEREHAIPALLRIGRDLGARAAGQARAGHLRHRGAAVWCRAGRIAVHRRRADNVLAARAAGWQALQFIDAADCEAQLRAGGWM